MYIPFSPERVFPDTTILVVKTFESSGVFSIHPGEVFQMSVSHGGKVFF